VIVAFESIVVITALEHLEQRTVVPLMEDDCAAGNYINYNTTFEAKNRTI